MEKHDDVSTFQLEFLGEYHDIVIDWNDDKYKYKETQLFELLEPITGIPRQYNINIELYNINHRNGGFMYHYISKQASGSDFRNSLNSAATCNSIRNAEGRFHLAYRAYYDPWFGHTRIYLILLPESLVPEGACHYDFCRHKNTKTFFNKLKNIINNDQLNAKIASLITPNAEDVRREGREICKQFNVLQYFHSLCITQHREYDFESEAVRIVIGDMKLYLRTRG
ncbi:uncharacterized protein LOC107365198 [Tetranychus urticae]|uniref:Uncharacterized protein n=1 Tax=Tetranychus urticae TaxID=32264 RepID=T1KL53_TETUR|nr:uncharacterized protein LOC107365198 [Tetranychus urticae]